MTTGPALWSTRPAARAAAAGFTLIELMVTIAILSILMMIAVPSFVDYRRNVELSAAANNMIGLLGTARSEALKRNADVQVEPLSGTDWTSGWRVYVDVDMDGSFDAAKDTLLLTTDPLNTAFLTASMAGTSNTGYMRFRGSGFSTNINGGFGIRGMEIRRTDVASTVYSGIRRIKVSSTGRVRVCTPTSASDTLCTGTSTADDT